MTANHRNWQHLGAMLTARMQEFGYTSEQLMQAADFPNRTYMTSILSGRARLKLEYVKPLAHALELDEDKLFWAAIEGLLEAEDISHFREFFGRLKVRKRKTKRKSQSDHRSSPDMSK